MSCASTDITLSPAMLKRTRCRSPSANSKLSNSLTPGTKCLVYLRRCLAVQLQKVGMFPNGTTTSCSTVTNFENTVERDAPLYWMYDSGYLIFQGFLEANLKCFWNGALIEAMKVLEFQGYIAPGVLLVSGSPCALEVVRAAWARNVLKSPNNYIISVVGDVEDCLVEPISQGQFTPLSEALCWIILDMTASGQAAVMESICSTMEVAFPDMQKPSQQMVYDTLAKLMAEKKLYQTSNGYFVMTPDKMRLSGLTNGKIECSESYIGGHLKQILLTPEEAAVVMHGEIETVRDGNVTHQAIQTNLADVICGGNVNDKVLYPRVSSRIRAGYSSERLERRHSLKFFGHGRRSLSLQRTGSIRHVADKAERTQTAGELTSADDVSKKQHTSLFSRLFRRSGRMRRDGSPLPVSRPTYSAQFPPPEWFNRGVTHLHSVGTQTSYLAPSTDTLPKRSFDYGLDDMSLQDVQQKRHISAFGTPRMIRRTSHSATLPRRTLKKSQLYGTTCTEKDSVSRISSQNSVVPATLNDTCTTPRTSSHSSISSSKTVIPKDHAKRSSPTHKSMSSASSGYNSLPRSICNSVRTNKTSSNCSSSSVRPRSKSKEKSPENSITFRVSAKSSSGYEDDSNSPKTETNATTMTTTINSGSNTKIFLQQHNTPIRSLITFENSLDKKEKPEVVIVNQPYPGIKSEAKENKKPSRPTTLHKDQNNLVKSNKQGSNILETQFKTKYPSTETIQWEEKCVENFKDEKLSKNDRPAKNKNLYVCGSATELNNAKNYLLFQNSNVDKINNLRNKNLLKEDDKFIDSEPTSPIIEHIGCKFSDLKKSNEIKIEKELEGLNLDDSQLRKYPQFPSLSDLSLRFTSLAAQSILKGVSFNSVDTLVEVNMAAEKKRNCEMSISTDLGVV